MQTFAIGLGRWWLARAVGRNPLIRGSDRLEALTVILAILAGIMAVPIGGAIGTSVHESRSRMYAEQARTRHPVTATAIQDSTTPPETSTNPTIPVRARWRSAGVVHTATVQVLHHTPAGQRFTIWVDGAGAYTSAPMATNQAAVDAIGAAVLFWLEVAVVAWTATTLLRRWLDRIRFAQWEYHFRDLVDNDGHRHSQS